MGRNLIWVINNNSCLTRFTNLKQSWDMWSVKWQQPLTCISAVVSTTQQCHSVDEHCSYFISFREKLAVLSGKKATRKSFSLSVVVILSDRTIYRGYNYFDTKCILLVDIRFSTINTADWTKYKYKLHCCSFLYYFAKENGKQKGNEAA